ncbi:MAG: HAAS signaling domain-containing protein, partial [Planctomycetota bacterium]
MTTLSLEARSLLDRYLAQIRLSLGGSASVDAEEVKRDVREHIEAEIGDREEPVAASELQRILDRLGDPEQWVGEDEIPLWRRVL